MKILAKLFSVVAVFLVYLPPSLQAQCIPQPDLEAVYKRAKPELAKDAGFLWQIEKDVRISHLYGTMHVLPENLVVPGKKTTQAFLGSDLLALEMDILDAKIIAEYKEEVKRAPDQMKLSVAQKDEAMRLAKSLCAEKDIDDAYPWSLKYTQISVAKMRSLGYEPAFGREIFFSIVAKGVQKSVYSLETVRVQVRALTEGWDVPAASVDKYLSGIQSGSTERMMQSMISMWSNNELEKFADLDSWCECKDDAFTKHLLIGMNDGRNPGMADNLDRLISSGKTVFAAVGALHMTGTLALPKLMEQKGYVVRRVF